MSANQPLPLSDETLEAAGEDCGTLTPLLSARIRKMESGRVIEVRTDDPAAGESLRSWCRLTGHTLAAVDTASVQQQRFFIRRK